MRNRLRLIVQGFRRAGAWAWAAVRSNGEELAVAVGLTLITAALWPDLGQRSLALPGVVVVWLWLPSRVPLLVRPPDPILRRKR